MHLSLISPPGIPNFCTMTLLNVTMCEGVTIVQDILDFNFKEGQKNEFGIDFAHRKIHRLFLVFIFAVFDLV